jgi:CheY-like chemotaxis protein
MKSPVILLVEDDEDDRYLAKRALARAGLRDVFDAVNGQEAINYILGNSPFCDRTAYPFPHIILLDLKIPVVNGHEVAEWIKTRPELNSCLVYVLSSSGEPRDRNRASVSSHGYFVKPLTAANITTICQHSSASPSFPQPEAT